MSSVPRTRGRRFLRPATKKSRKVRESPSAKSYQTTEAMDPSHVTSNVLNAIDHLGNQRFMLPPYSDHYERWLKDFQSLLEEFEKQVPEVVDVGLHQQIVQSMNEVKHILAERVKLENTQSDETNKLQQQLAHYDAELSQLEHTHRTHTQEVRKEYEKNSQKIRDEIDRLDKRRIQILRRKTNVLRRFFRKPDDSASETGIALDSRRVQLREIEQNFQNDLRKSQEEYAANRQRLISEIESLRQKIRDAGAAGDDALEVRQEICQRIRTAIMKASQRTQEDTSAATN